jgi:hypothetical protein
MMVRVYDLAKEMDRRPNVVYDHIKRLGIKTVQDTTDKRKRPRRLVTADEADVVRESLKEAPRAGGRRRPRKPRAYHRAITETLPGVRGAHCTWDEFEACARKLAVMCKQLRITSLEIEVTTSDDKPKVTYEQNNQGEISV